MHRDQVGFDVSFRRHLLVEQRKAVLEAIGNGLDPATRIGEVIDIAEALGWGDTMANLCLADLAEVLIEADEPGTVGELGGAPPAQRPQPTRSRAAVTAGPQHLDDDDEDPGSEGERMSLERAAEVFRPLVEDLGKATMQDLENRTGIGRRKLRFHIGQLVKHGYLDRHGMGRGTYYTVA